MIAIEITTARPRSNQFRGRALLRRRLACRWRWVIGERRLTRRLRSRSSRVSTAQDRGLLESFDASDSKSCRCRGSVRGGGGPAAPPPTYCPHLPFPPPPRRARALR